MLTLDNIQEVAHFVHPAIHVNFNYAGAFQEEIVFMVQAYGCGATSKMDYAALRRDGIQATKRIAYQCEELIAKLNSVIAKRILNPYNEPLLCYREIAQPKGLGRSMQDMGYHPIPKRIACDIIDI